MGDTAATDILLFLELCGAIELANARLYHTFANFHTADPEIAALWRKAAREEENHAAQFNVARLGNAGMVAGTNLSLDAVRGMKCKIDEVISEAIIQPPTPRRALQIAGELEDSMAELHSVTALVFAHASHKRLFQAMMAADRGHVETLRAALLAYE